MAETAFRGPLLNLGATLDTSSSPFDGPNLTYQGGMLIDPRLNNPAAKDSVSPGAIPGFLLGNAITVIDQIPSSLSTTTIAAAQVVTAAVAVTLATTAPGGEAAGVPSWAPGIPIIPAGTTVAVTVSAIDFGFTTGTTTANSSTVVLVDNKVVSLGQWLVIGGAGNSGKTAGLITQVASVSSNGTAIFISPVAAGSLDNAPIGQGNLFNNNLPPASQFGPAAASANAAVPYRVAGFGLAFDPVQAMTRNLTVAAASVEGGTAAIVVTGYDIWGNQMTELLTATGTTLVNGKKGFKYIASILGNVTGSSVVTVGIGDIVGLPLRADRFNQVGGGVVLGNNLMATAKGFTAAVVTVATNTSGDVRGTLTMNQLGGAIGTSGGTARLSVTMAVPLLSLLNATPSNSTSMFGVAQA